MIFKKIKAIRLMLGLSETQVSNIIYVSSYKYKHCEKDDAYISTEMLILLSVIYKTDLYKFLSEEYSANDLTNEEYLKNLKKSDSEQIEAVLKSNLCSDLKKERKNANSTTIDMLLKSKKKIIQNNLKRIRESRGQEISQMAELIGTDLRNYISMESRSKIPTPKQLIEFSQKLNIPLSELTEE